MYVYPSPHEHRTVKTILTVTPINRLHKSDGSNGVNGAAEEDKNRIRPYGPNGSMSMGQKKVEPILCVESLTRRRSSMNRTKHGKILEEHLKDRGLFTMNNLSTTFRVPKGRLGLQGKDLFNKEKTCSTRKRLGLQGKKTRPHYYKSPNTPSHQDTHN